MSTFNNIDITCAECGHEYQAILWTAIHAGQDPELKEMLLGGELNLIMCPECAHVSYQDHFLLYQDPAAELLAYVHPPAEQSREEELRKMVVTGFQEAQAIYDPKDRIQHDPILLFGLDSLVELLEHEQEEGDQSDVAEFVCREKGIPFSLLTPAKARQKALPRVLPSGQNPPSTSRESVLAGVDRLLEINPALEIYDALRERIKADPSWLI